MAEFYNSVNPIWKLGIKYLWGPRKSFNYAFGTQLTTEIGLPRPLAYYLDDVDYANLSATLMTTKRAFARRREDGLPLITHDHAYHLENRLFVDYLEQVALRSGVEIIDDTVTTVEQDEAGIKLLRMASGRVESGFLYFDCSGFASELLGKALGEPFVSYKAALFCERAVVGGWARGIDEPIQPYTTAQTMEAGWSWRIDHEHTINRGYVFSSSFISDDAAEQEFRRKNPKLGPTRIVKFRSGRFKRFWVKNVVAIGNASGFVEPMEATAIAAICDQTMAVVKPIQGVLKISPKLRQICNMRNERYWDAIPRFLAVHYKFNTLVDSPFWRAIWNDINLYGAEDLIDYYKECGPDQSLAQTLVDNHDQFGLGSYIVMLLGQNVPYNNRHQPSVPERMRMDQWRIQQQAIAATGYTAEQALAMIRSPGWSWTADFYNG